MLHLLRQSATIQAEAATGQVPAQTGMGGATRATWVTAVEGVACLYRPTSATLFAGPSRRNDARQQQCDGRIYFAGDPVPGGLTTRHRIVLSGCPRDADDGTYAITGVIDANAMGRLLEVDVERVRP